MSDDAIEDCDEAAPWGGLLPWGRRIVLADSITEAVGIGTGLVVVSGSHGGASAARYALAVRAHLAVFNDAGVGREGAGIASLELLQAAGLAACTVAHTSACIGQARSSLEHGVVSHANEGAVRLGARVGLPLLDWLRAAGTPPP